MGFTATVEDAPVQETLPEDTIFKAKLLDITTREQTWTKNGEQKSATFLNWKWEITGAEEPEYIGRWAFGSCDSRLSNHPNNKFRLWSESLLNRQLEIGAGIDTEDLIGLSAEITIKHRADKNDAAKKYAEVDDVIPLAGGFQLSDEPPF